MDFSQILKYFVLLFQKGLTVTIPLTLSSFAIGLVIAVVTALIRISKFKIPSTLCAGYIWIIRGTPLLVQLFIVFYGLPKIGIQLNAWPAAILAFSLNVGAYSSEAIRAAILAIPKGQWEAAQSLGMTKSKVFLRVIMPQAGRICLPPLSNTFISLVKDTSLASIITIIDAFRVAQQIVATTYEPLILYSEVAIVYLIFCTVLSVLQSKLERYFSKHERR